MKHLSTISLLLLIILSGVVTAQQKEKPQNQQTQTDMEDTMKTYVIERELNGAGDLTEKDLQAISQTSCTVLSEMDQNNIQWLHSYVTENKIFCVYRAKNKQLIEDHAKKGKFPCNSVNLVSNRISPETANSNNLK